MDHAGSTVNPQFLRERLAERLREERDRVGLKQADSALRVGWSLSKLQRVESAMNGISASDTKALLAVYGVQDETVVERLTRLACLSRRRDRFSPYRKFLGAEFQVLLSHEQSAAEILAVDAFSLPDLLQTSVYARTSLAVKYSGEQLEGHISVRAARREILDRPDGPRLVFVVDEGVLHRQVGGSQVLHDQITYLRQLAERPKIDLRVIPFTTQAHLGLWERYSLITVPASDLTGEPERTTVYRKDSHGEFLLDDSATVERYRATFAHILSLSCTREQTRDLLDQHVEQLAAPGAPSEGPHGRVMFAHPV